MQGSSVWSGSGNGFDQEASSHTSNQTQITNASQNNSRINGSMTSRHIQEGSSDFRTNFIQWFNGLRSLMHTTSSPETQGNGIRNWLRQTNQAEHNLRSDNSESVVINFESIQEPSTSYSQQSYSNNVNIQSSEIGKVENSTLGERVNQQNITNQVQENSTINTLNLAPASHFNERAQAESSNVTHTTENQSLDVLFNKYFPFITLIVMKVIYDHREGILIFVGLLVTFSHANSVVKREVGKQGRRSLFSLAILFVNLFVCICFIYFVFRDQHLYKILVFMPPYTPPLTIWDLLWMVGITDFVLKFITIQLKIGMACFPAKLLPYSARGKWYLMLECTSQLYRGLVPIQPWLYYLREVYKGPENAVGMFFSVGYMVSKGSDLISKVKLFIKSLWKLLQDTNLGTRPSKEQLDTSGSQCPICHDEYNAPIMLHCRHVFCEACVTTWFDREQTCPLCRAKVAGDPSWRDGSTSFFTQIF